MGRRERGRRPIALHTVVGIRPRIPFAL